MAFCGAAIDTPTRSFLVVSPASQPSASSVCCLPAPLSLPHSSRCAGGIAAAAVAWCGLFSAAGCASADRRGGKSRLQASLCPPVCLSGDGQPQNRRRGDREREGSTSAQPAGPGDASPARRLASLARAPMGWSSASGQKRGNALLQAVVGVSCSPARGTPAETIAAAEQMPERQGPANTARCGQ